MNQLIEKYLENIGKDFQSQQANSEITKYPSCKQLLEYLTQNWMQLCAFRDCPEISMDERKLCVKIRRPAKKNISPDYASTRAVKAIFHIEELDLRETPLKYKRVPEGVVIRPSRLDVTEKCFGPATPPTKKRASSSIKMDK